MTSVGIRICEEEYVTTQNRVPLTCRSSDLTATTRIQKNQKQVSWRRSSFRRVCSQEIVCKSWMHKNYSVDMHLLGEPVFFSPKNKDRKDLWKDAWSPFFLLCLHDWINMNLNSKQVFMPFIHSSSSSCRRVCCSLVLDVRSPRERLSPFSLTLLPPEWSLRRKRETQSFSLLLTLSPLEYSRRNNYGSNDYEDDSRTEEEGKIKVSLQHPMTMMDVLDKSCVY